MRILISLLLLLLCAALPLHAAKVVEKSPIAIDADTLEVIQSQRKAIFNGNVVAKQGDMTIYSDTMSVFYNEAKSGGESAMGALSRIEVIGNVRMNTTDESAQGNKGLYDAERNKVFLFGNVVLKRGNNILNGSTLEYNLTSGTSLLTGGASGSGTAAKSSGKGRVRGIFVPNGN
jgi:lipopolysaccharide export system protein LptA